MVTAGGERGLQAMLPIYKTLLQDGFTVLLNEDVYRLAARFDLSSEYSSIT